MLFGTAIYDGKHRPTGVDDPLIDADNGRGWVGQQVTVFGRFVRRAIAPRFLAARQFSLDFGRPRNRRHRAVAAVDSAAATLA